ncbi:alpha/beta hydrolase [Mariniluteicoccus flavus]
MFLPVIGGTERQFTHQLEHFGRDHRAIAVTLRGNGESPELDVPVDEVVRTQANDLVMLLDRLQVSRAHVVGTIYGGAVAQRFAIDHPRIVRSLTLVDTWSDATGRTPAEKLMNLSALATPATYRLPKAVVRSAVMSPYLPRWPEAAHVMGSFVSNGRLPEQALQQRAQNGVRMTGELRKLTMPVFGLAGDAAPWMVSMMRRTMGAVPAGRLELVKGAFHPSNLTAPEEFNRLLRGFLEGQRAY